VNKTLINSNILISLIINSLLVYLCWSFVFYPVLFYYCYCFSVGYLLSCYCTS